VPFGLEKFFIDLEDGIRVGSDRWVCFKLNEDFLNFKKVNLFSTDVEKMLR
jgi:hypothetical protein